MIRRKNYIPNFTIFLCFTDQKFFLCFYFVFQSRYINFRYIDWIESNEFRLYFLQKCFHFCFASLTLRLEWISLERIIICFRASWHQERCKFVCRRNSQYVFIWAESRTTYKTGCRMSHIWLKLAGCFSEIEIEKKSKLGLHLNYI